MLTFLPADLESYVSEHSSPEPPVFRALAKDTATNTDQPEMQVGAVEGFFLKILVRAIGARRVVEIGTFTGYSALMMAEGLADGGHVITCDIDPKATDIARRHWAKSPHGKKIELRLGPALGTLDEIEGPIDFTFIDADKENYIEYWEKVLPKMRTGGLIAVDNVLWSGEVTSPVEPVARAIAAFNDHARKDDRVDLVMLSIRDGVTLACKR